VSVRIYIYMCVCVCVCVCVCMPDLAHSVMVSRATVRVFDCLSPVEASLMRAGHGGPDSDVD
jgi:hypothetical protein